MEVKAVVRRVATAAGAKRYGQPIGSVITTDPVSKTVVRTIGSALDKGGPRFHDPRYVLNRRPTPSGAPAFFRQHLPRGNPASREFGEVYGFTVNGPNFKIVDPEKAKKTIRSMANRPDVRGTPIEKVYVAALQQIPMKLKKPRAPKKMADTPQSGGDPLQRAYSRAQTQPHRMIRKAT